MFRGPLARMRRPAFPPAAPGAGRAATLVALALLAGCAVRRPPVPAAPAGYERRVDDLAAADTAGLRGRRIALDPGHGGFFAGSRGAGGLTEAEVNLGVALELRDLLVSAGAEVFLTRDRDRDFLSPADSALRTDLAERVRLANQFAPDVFVSIHHNADPQARHDVNETVTYYKLGDDGPSLELAESVHRALVRNVGIRPHRVVPGNFAVVRGSRAPAILTETSYLTYPPTEARLRLPESRRLEAEALYLGIASYFARRIPVIEAFEPGAKGQPAEAIFAGTSRPTLRARIRGAFDAARMTVAGAPVTPERDGEWLWWTAPAPLPIGAYEATLSVRLAGEGTSPVAQLRFHVANAPRRVVAEFPDQVLWDGRQPLALRVQVLDQDGVPMPDSVSVRVRSLRPRWIAPADTIVEVRDGAAWAYFRPATTLPPRRSPSVVEVVASAWPPLLGEFATPLVDSAVARIARHPELEAPVRTGFARIAPADTVLRNAVGTPGAEPAIAWLNRDGFVRLPEDSLGLEPRRAGPVRPIHVPALPGYRPWVSDTTWPPRFVAIAGGALHGRRVVIDPDGGGGDPGGVGPGGSRASTLNLEAARSLAAMLRAAGAEVRLTRDGERAMSEVERVESSEAFRAERFLRIGHRAEPPQLGHYFASAAGRRWAERTALELARLGLPAPPPRENAQYPIQQASATALYAGLARLDDPLEEARLLAPGALRAEAYALYLALAAEGAPDAAWALDSLEVRDAADRPVAGAAVTFGGALVLETDALGRVRFARTEPGPMDVRVDDPRVRARTVLLDSSHGTILTGPSGR